MYNLLNISILQNDHIRSLTIIIQFLTIVSLCTIVQQITQRPNLASTCMIVQVSEKRLNFNKKTSLKNSFFLTTKEFDFLFSVMLNDIVWKILELKQKK